MEPKGLFLLLLELLGLKKMLEGTRGIDELLLLLEQQASQEIGEDLDQGWKIW